MPEALVVVGSDSEIGRSHISSMCKGIATLKGVSNEPIVLTLGLRSISMDIARAQMKVLTEEERRALEGILSSNGFDSDILTQPQEQQITHLEFFLHDYSKMMSLHMFPHLRTLCLIHQGIKEIACLDECPLLEKLWIVENEVRQINGLSKLTKLRELYLHDNKIARMENLSHLTNLEVLWLSDNYIPAIEDIVPLTRLRDLNLARNDIISIGDSLVTNTALEILNLADNALGSFKEVRPLTRLPHLTDLCFADPMWGDCPLAAQCNYQTYVLFMLPQLTSLDTLLLADETKQLAEATFLKKQMYYNMRIKTMHRNARNIIKLANEGRKVHAQVRQPLLAQLVQQQRALQRELEEVAYYKEEPSGVENASQSSLLIKMNKIEELLAQYSQEAGDMEVHFEDCASRTYQVMDAHVGRMLLELDTAGNIRLEEGRPTDLWYSSCVDLVQSRFNAADYDTSLGVTGVNVTGVTRIHNRWLRNRFEKQLAGLVDTGDTNHKRSMEYLFLGEHPALPGDMDRIVENGMLPGSSLAAMGLDNAVVLSNSLLLSDQLRVQAVLEARSVAASASGPHPGGHARAEQPAMGRIMIVKVFLGRTAADSHSLTINRLSSTPGTKLYSKDGRLMPSACLEGPRVDRKQVGETVDAVHRSRAGDPKHRLWYMFDHMLILPEYLVQFQYELSPSSVRLARQQASTSAVCLDEALPQTTVLSILNDLEPDLRPLARPLMGWLSLHFDPSIASQLYKKSGEESQVTSILALQPIVPARAKLSSMTAEKLQDYLLRALDLSTLTYLNLHSCGLCKIESMSQAKQLKVLVLSFNDITRIEGLSDLQHLQRLDLAYNMIKKVEGLKGLASLNHLDLSCNMVVKLEEIYGLKKYVPSLTHLDLSGNALAEDKSYRPTVLRKLSSLIMFDGRKVTDDEKSMFGDNAGALTLAMILEHGTTGHRVGMADAGLSSLGLSPGLQPAQIQELVLERRHIRRLQALSQMVNLRRASFADNQISHIEGLEACTALEELCMEDNRLGKIEGLQGLTRLKKLQLGKNRLVTLDMMHCVTNLTQLSVEDNELPSLAGLEPLVCLMELYAGNNRLSELREVQRLRDLPKIIILDLSGNPCAATAVDDYRLYVIYNVRKLKVLDGTPIDATEQAAAKSKYSGRLTSEFLEEKLGHRTFDRIRDLDVSGLKVRDVGNVFLSGELDSLQELNLDSNLLVEVSGLALLRDLVGLKLNSNRLGEECTFNPRRMIEKNADLYKAVTDPARQQALANQPGQPTPAFELFPFIQALQLGSNQIASIASLQLGSLTSLRTLFLNNNDITRIDGLEGLVNLQELVLDRNRIRYIDPEAFVGLLRLRELRLEENGLRSLANLHHLTALQSLHVSYNRIAEPVELDRLTGMTNLIEINLLNNPVNRKLGYRTQLITRLPRLCTVDGQAVTVEEQEYAENMLAAQQGMTGLGDPMAGLLAAKAGGQAIRLTNVDFTNLASAANQYGPLQVGGCVPSIPSGMLVLTGSAGLGLEGMGLGQAISGLGAATLGLLMGGGYTSTTTMAEGARDMRGRPTSNDRRGALMGPGSGANVRGAANARPGGPAAAIGNSPVSPARRAIMGRPHAGYRT